MRDLCNPDGSCSHRCGQGDCEGSRRASCMALGLHRLVQVDGGESVDTKPKSRAIDYLMAGLVVFFVLGLAAVSVFK